MSNNWLDERGALNPKKAEYVMRVAEFQQNSSNILLVIVGILLLGIIQILTVSTLDYTTMLGSAYIIILVVLSLGALILFFIGLRHYYASRYMLYLYTNQNDYSKIDKYFPKGVIGVTISTLEALVSNKFMCTLVWIAIYVSFFMILFFFSINNFFALKLSIVFTILFPLIFIMAKTFARDSVDQSYAKIVNEFNIQKEKKIIEKLKVF